MTTDTARAWGGKLLLNIIQPALIGIGASAIGAYVTINSLSIKVEALERKLPALEAKIDESKNADTLHIEKLKNLEIAHESYTKEVLENRHRAREFEQRLIKLETLMDSVNNKISEIAANLNFLINTEPRISPRKAPR